MKTVTNQFGTFVTGWTKCQDCDKRIKFTMLPELMIMGAGMFDLCIDCYWNCFADLGKEDYKRFRIITRTMRNWK